MPGPIYKRAAETMEAEIGDELVALDVDAGNCFAFNEIASSVWRSLSEPKSFEQLRDELVGEYDVHPEQCTIELQELLDDLVDEGLVERVD